ncbi:MAG: hypothetical protein FD134_418 [Gallionellaceae bacterium]|nr:MAG: hypothetical protein FD134_418 [Gallionellaceae bacterium]
MAFKHQIFYAITLALCLGAGSALAAAQPAAGHDHAHHGGAAQPALDNGKKWAIDEPLRKAMGAIRDAVAASLDGIHNGKFADAEYAGLAKKIGGEVEYMVGNCKLDPKADAQLHLIIADILAGIETMEGKRKKIKRMDGAVKVIGALEKYPAYFDDPGWKPLKH